MGHTIKKGQLIFNRKLMFKFFYALTLSIIGKTTPAVEGYKKEE
jgi:hypothetical protein